MGGDRNPTLTMVSKQFSPAQSRATTLPNMGYGWPIMIGDSIKKLYKTRQIGRNRRLLQLPLPETDLRKPERGAAIPPPRKPEERRDRWLPIAREGERDRRRRQRKRGGGKEGSFDLRGWKVSIDYSILKIIYWKSTDRSRDRRSGDQLIKNEHPYLRWATTRWTHLNQRFGHLRDKPNRPTCRSGVCWQFVNGSKASSGPTWIEEPLSTDVSIMEDSCRERERWVE